MATLTIKDVDSRYDGIYPADDLFNPSIGEGISLRERSGLYPSDMLEAYFKGDAGVRMALAMMILERAGKFPDKEPFLMAPLDALSFELDMPAVDENPPEQPPSGGIGPDDATERSAGNATSGFGSTKSSETETPPDREGSGTPPLVASAASDRATSKT